jgi:hypothetical protein
MAAAMAVEQSASDAAAEAGAAEPARGYKWGTVRLTPEQQQVVQASIGAWQALEPKQQTLSTFLRDVRLGGGGVNGTQAARIAMSQFNPAELRKMTKSRGAFTRLMKGQGVSDAVVHAWATKVFGAAGRPLGTEQFGTHMPNPNTKPADTSHLQGVVNENKPSNFRVGMKVNVGERVFTVKKVTISGGKAVIHFSVPGGAIVKITKGA